MNEVLNLGFKVVGLSREVGCKLLLHIEQIQLCLDCREQEYDPS